LAKWVKSPLALTENALGSEHPKTATSLQGLALVYWKQRRYSEAEQLFQRTLAIFERMLGQNHLDTQIVRQNVISIQVSMNQGQQEEK
jgi:tetratricopeptide repeat protein